MDNLFEALLFYEIVKDADKTEWIELDTDTQLSARKYYQCKRCGFYNNHPTRFCPNCGREAKRKDK